MSTWGTGIWRSADRGANWQPVDAYPGNANIQALVAYPNVPDRVYAISEGAGAVGPALYVSRDAGSTWEEVLYGQSSPDVGGLNGLYFAPPQPGARMYRLYSRSGDGLLASLDEGLTWAKVQGVPRVLSLASASDGARLVVYVGSSGGMASYTPAAQASSSSAEAVPLAPAESDAMGGGVYRSTLRLPDQDVYVPLVVRGQ